MSSTRYDGSLVAFEGPADVVSTQLRLLPTSSQILVLPDLQHYMTRDCPTNTRFSPRSYIKDVHDAALARREIALKFLNESSSDNKRLVFFHGGTAGAVSQCISAISERETSGDDHMAEVVFREFAMEGVRGLENLERYANQEALERLGSERGVDELLQEDDEDPIIKAMRAADLLYKETESLQPIDCYIRTRPRSLSLPSLAAFTDDYGQASPFFIFGPPPNEEDESVFNGVEEDEYTGSPQEEGPEVQTKQFTQREHQTPPRLTISVPTRPPSSMTEATMARSEDRPGVPLRIPTADSVLSPPTSPEGVVYGEARLVQMHGSRSPKPHRRTRSLDDMEMTEARSRRATIALPLPKNVSPLDSPEAKSRHLSIVEDPYPSHDLVHLPDARVVKAQKTTIRRSPTFVTDLPKPARDDYVHRGIDAPESDNQHEAFRPVLPFHEDLVIHFTGGASDYVLDSVIQALKDGSLPVTPGPPGSFGTLTETSPSTPRTADLFDVEDSEAGLSPVVEATSSDEASDYDPFAARGNDVRSSAAALRPPSSPQTPTPCPSASGTDSRFRNFLTTGRPNAVAIQNALRRVLEEHFPSGQVGGYRQFSLPSLADMDRLWKPIFADAETSGSKSSGRTADLILVIGRQIGVKKELLSALTGQIEKLGAKSNGLSRSGRLDIRYLIANTMQSISTSSLIHHGKHNPFDNPYSLACLLIPQLDTYLATNVTTRFLVLEYPNEHLPTVLALQELTGADMVKIAGIVDSEQSPSLSQLPCPSPLSPGAQSSFSDIPTPTFEEILADVSPPESPYSSGPQSSSAPSRKRQSFSRADYLLPSTATEAEIASFISVIWKVLIDADAYYAPEAPSSPPSTTPARSRPPARALPPHPLSKFAVPLASPPQTPDGRESFFRAQPPLPPPPRMGGRDESPSRASVLSRSQGARSRPRSLAASGSTRTRGGGDDGASLYAVSVVGDGEFYDDEERRLMPMYLRPNERRKGNSRKALKWLGLA